MRAHVGRGLSWSTVGEQVPWALTSVQRWHLELAARVAEVVTGLLAVWQWLDHQAPTEMRTGGTRDGLLRALFRVCDAVGDLLPRQEGWPAPVPGLAIPPMFRPAAPDDIACLDLRAPARGASTNLGEWCRKGDGR